MRVGTINFGTDFSNFKDCYLDWLIEKKPVVLSCRICGMKLAPFVEHVGPRNAGWVKVQGRYGGYICHQCYGHGMHMTHEGLDTCFQMPIIGGIKVSHLQKVYKRVLLRPPQSGRLCPMMDLGGAWELQYLRGMCDLYRRVRKVEAETAQIFFCNKRF